MGDQQQSSKDQVRSGGTEAHLPQVGEILCGTYRLDRVLGWGAVGIVYAAWHLELRRPCAVKLLHPSFAESTDIRERFRREALSSFKLSHPFIIRVLDFREDENGWPFMVMELLQGESLRQRLQRGPLPVEQVRTLYEQLCQAMALAHEQGIVHRDLKPENIFLSRQPQPGGGEVEVAKVLDFGISKVTEQPEITAIHALLGSPSYMSPEQARGDARTVDARADIFSLGAILFECLTGRKAFLAADPEEKRRLILSGAVPPLRDFQPELPASVDLVIRRACAVQPENRFQSAAELVHGLLLALAEVRVAPSHDPILNEATVLTASPPAPAVALPAPAVALPAPAVALPAPAPPAPPSPVSPAPAPPVEQDERTLAVQPLTPVLPRASADPPAVAQAGFLDGLFDRMRSAAARRPQLVRLLERTQRAVRGRELLVFLVVLFLVVLVVLVLLETFGPESNPIKHQRAKPRLQIIDGQHQQGDGR